MTDFSLHSIPLAEHWMAQAYELAQAAAERDEVPVGAVLVHDGNIIGIGGNTREQTKRTVAHAEVMAIEDYNRRTSSWRVPTGTALYVTTEPCLMCTGALLWARVDQVYFGCSDTKNAGLQKIAPLIHNGIYDHRFTEVRGGILGDRCSLLMSGYFQKKRASKSANKLPGNPPTL